MSQSKNKINELYNRIENLKQDLSAIKQLEQPQPEFINTTNVLRSNEYLAKEIEKQSELLTLYEKYSKELENLVVSTSAIKFQIKRLKSHISSKRKTNRTQKRRKKNKPKIKKRTRKIKKKPRKKR
jgi:DNA repair ATPase RecN